MKLYIDVYYKNKETKTSHILHDTITEEDIERLVKEKTQDCRPMWMTDKWEYDSISIDKINL